MTADDPTTAPAPSSPDCDADLTSIAVLGDPLRRALYRYVIAQGVVNRDQVAEGTGVARHVAKFHLDKLVREGLLAVEYARPPGRRGPGAGRPAKFYRRSSGELAVSLPQRDYELVGRLLAEAVTDAERHGAPVGDALGQAARRTGRTLGCQARQRAGAQPNPSTLLAAATSVLRAWGYEPCRDDTGFTLANCPFHALAQDYTDLVCGINLELMSGLVDGLELASLDAHLEPTPGRCCVRLRTSRADCASA